MFKLMVCGSRTFDDYELLETKLDEYLEKNKIEKITLISGGNKTTNSKGQLVGADYLAECWAYNNDMDVLRFLPDWFKYGKAAGPIRNKIMTRKADYMIAFWDGNSKGTKNAIECMEKFRKPFTIHYCGPEEIKYRKPIAGLF